MSLAAEPLAQFVAESNRIEGIERAPTESEIEAHRLFMELPAIRLQDVENMARVVAGSRGRLRRRLGADVRIEDDGELIYLPPPGGPQIEAELRVLLDRINSGELSAWEAHFRYEGLHPFIDGNGRSGRAIWAWQMLRSGADPFAIGFLRRAYYQALEASRLAVPECTPGRGETRCPTHA